jgi:hypothetical protein
MMSIRPFFLVAQKPFCAPLFVFLLPVIEAAFAESVIGNSSDGCLRLGEIPE